MQHELVARPIQHVNGWMEPLREPGLGIEVVEEVVERFRSDR
jgi:L-alanine-DL-glutamate epimerase-like enolase superfamily enzyme